MRFRVIGALFVLVFALGICSSALAQRALVSSKVLKAESAPGGLEGACGVAIRPAGGLYVSDYYHHAVDAFIPGSGGPLNYLSQTPFDPLDGPCQLAGSAGGALYANSWHKGAARVLPSALSFDSSESTGIAVDQTTGNLYVDDRTYIAVYEPSGAPVLKEGLPLKIGQGTLTDAYGLALFGTKLYVPDAGDETVKIFEPALDTVGPAFTIDGKATPQGHFNSLVDAAVAVDPTNGHLLVLDNLQPGFERPKRRSMSSTPPAPSSASSPKR